MNAMVRERDESEGIEQEYANREAQMRIEAPQGKPPDRVWCKRLLRLVAVRKRMATVRPYERGQHATAAEAQPVVKESLTTQPVPPPDPEPVAEPGVSPLQYPARGCEYREGKDGAYWNSVLARLDERFTHTDPGKVLMSGGELRDVNPRKNSPWRRRRTDE